MMIRMTFFFMTLITLATTHIVATHFFLYWKYFWLDIPMHILGGICVALGVSILPFFKIKLPQRYMHAFGYLLIVFMVGVLWEAFEYSAGISIVNHEDFFIDTMIDLCLDLVGGALGYAFIKRIMKLEI